MATNSSIIATLGLALALGGGCLAKDGNDPGFGDGVDPTGAGGSTSSDDSGNTSPQGEDEGVPPDDDGMSPVKFDTNQIPEGPEITEPGCQKVDFLFVIDNSGSMSDNQANLVANFPNFITGIQTSLDTVDSYHVGVVTTDAYTYNTPGCNQLGGLVVSTGGNNSSNAVCGPYADGWNFMTDNDDLAATFPCTAAVGTVGSATERPMQAMETVALGSLAAPGLCNEEFIRADALLVVVVITDEGGDSPGTPASWFNTVVTAKGGFMENVAVVSLVTNSASDLHAFTNMFGANGFIGDVLLSDYGPLFTQAVSVIDDACAGFIPPG